MFLSSASSRSPLALFLLVICILCTTGTLIEKDLRKEPLNDPLHRAIRHASVHMRHTFVKRQIVQQPLDTSESEQRPSLLRNLRDMDHTAKSTMWIDAPSSLARQKTVREKTELNYDPCSTTSECREPRRCLPLSLALTNVAQQCVSSSDECVCYHGRNCVYGIHCDPGEDCALLQGYPECVSKQTLREKGVMPLPSSSENEDDQLNNFGLNLDLCSFDSDCLGQRECVAAGPLSIVSCSSEYVVCFCLDRSPFQECGSDADCANGESCQTFFGIQFCITRRIDIGNIISDAQVAMPDSRACIAIHSLQHLKQNELLFDQPRTANVLCDSGDNCATPGHIVSYEEKLMMMKTYCALTRCTSKVMYVNSPRFRRAMRIDSNTESLLFTAVAARYESVAEEQLLSFAVKIGLL